MRILVCGDRNWEDEKCIENALKKYPTNTILIHGNCRGADKLSGIVAKKLGMEVIPFPANWGRYGKGAGHVRNQQMLDEGKPEKIIAFHSNLEKSKGTLNMVTKARKAKLPVEIIKSLEAKK